MTRLVLGVCLGFAGFCEAGAASAQAPRDAGEGDYLFPAALQPSVTLATGSPYVAITDVAIGLGSHAAFGVLAGVTPRVAGVGAQPRFAWRFDADWRVFLRVPVLYYPETNDASEWMLTRPSLVLERRAPLGLRFYAGGGALYAACLAELFGDRDAPEHQNHQVGPGHGRTLPDGSTAPMEVLFWTLNLGAALHLSERVDGFLDLASIMDGASLAGPEWSDFGGPPIMAVLGVAARF